MFVKVKYNPVEVRYHIFEPHTALMIKRGHLDIKVLCKITGLVSFFCRKTFQSFVSFHREIFL